MENLLTYWMFDWGAVILTVFLTYAYFKLSGGKLVKGAGSYFSGVVLMLLITSSPLHFLGMHYLLSAYMLVHIFLLLLCGPLLVIGLPKNLPTENKVLKTISSTMKRWPWLGWIAGIGLMWFWHIPIVFDAVFPMHHAAFGFHILPVLHTVTLLFAGVLFAWPIMGPIKTMRLHPLLGIVYLFTACIGCSILGLYLTFAPPTLYSHYFMPDEYGFSNMIVNNWNISRSTDQQAAGLIMWVPCCFIYISGCCYLFLSWIKDKEIPKIKTPIWKGSYYE
ncbi:putative membrane protein [Pedobacter sp. UYP30]|uniref:cytochrome c oxidase assembly protein n=1 Tax=Pedobacter sp. UYP30 TaxID=1756400 RepID=UPI00339B2FFC